MKTLIGERNGLPFFINPDDLLRIDGNRSAERIIEIAVALQKAGINGICVQCVQYSDDRFVVSLDLLQGSLGEYLMNFFADYAREQKKIFSVDAALVIAEEFKKQESEGRDERHN